jgi:hypothetical protein
MGWLLLAIVFVVFCALSLIFLKNYTVSYHDEESREERTKEIKLSKYRLPVGIIFGILAFLTFVSLSLVNVPSDKVGHLKRIYLGSHMPAGRVIALDGEKGLQAKTLAPGFHFIFLIDVLYDVEMIDMVSVAEGQYGILVARDGKPLTAGQYLADEWPTDEVEKYFDAEYFMGEGNNNTPRGQKGPQINVLKPGRYRLNRYLFDVKLEVGGRSLHALDVPAGFVAVVKSNVGVEYEGEAIVPVSVVEAYTEEVRVEMFREQFESDDEVEKPVVVVEKDDSAVEEETVASPEVKPEKEVVVRGVLSEADLVQVTKEAKNRALRALSVPIVPKGHRGVWKDVITPGRYYLNYMAYEVHLVDTRIQTWEYAGGYERRWINLEVKQNGEIVQESKQENIPKKEGAADSATLIRVEGWDIFLDSRILMQVTPDNAPYVVASVGGIQEAEDKIITPAYKSVSRNVIGHEDRRALDVLYHREVLEDAVEVRIVPEGKKAGIIIREIRFGDPMVPPELLLPGKRRQLAEQLKQTYKKEQEAQAERIVTEEQRALADQQPKLIEARIAKEAALERKQEKKLNGEGEELRLKAIARGEMARKNVLGSERVTELAMLKMLLEAIAQTPELVKMPTVLVNGGGSSLEGAAAILGHSNLSSMVGALKEE